MPHQFLNHGQVYGYSQFYKDGHSKMGVSPNRQQLNDVLKRIGDSPKSGYNSGQGPMIWDSTCGGSYSPCPSSGSNNRECGTLGGYYENPYARN